MLKAIPAIPIIWLVAWLGGFNLWVPVCATLAVVAYVEMQANRQRR